MNNNVETKRITLSFRICCIRYNINVFCEQIMHLVLDALSFNLPHLGIAYSLHKTQTSFT